MRKIIEARCYDIDGLNNYIERNKIQETDIISLTYVDGDARRMAPYASKIVLYHYEVKNE